MKLRLHLGLFLSLLILINIFLPAQERRQFSPLSIKDLKNLKAESLNLLRKLNTQPPVNNFLQEAGSNESWSGDFGLPGTDQMAETGYVLSVAATGNDIYIGGFFRYAQDSLVNSIARLDGIKFCPLGEGTDGIVYVIKAVDDKIYVGGIFATAGSIPAGGIAMWDGSSWHALGEGVNGAVASIEISGTNVYVGGEFDTAGTSPANNVAVWNGSAWSSLGDGTSGVVNALKMVGSDLYLGGHFTTAGGITVNNIAKWNGSGYDSLASGTNGVVNSIGADGSNIYAGGEFLKAGGITVNNIAKWENNIWSQVGSGVDGSVNDIVVYNGSVYIGGRFENAGILTASGIARWDGLQWNTLGDGMSLSIPGIPGIILSLSFIDGFLFAGGAFDRAGNISTNNLAYWDGIEWKGVGPNPVIGGANYQVSTVVMHDGELYSGGRFRRIGNIAAGCIAKWNGSAWTEIGGGVKSSADPPEVNAICFTGSDIYIGGYFDMAGTINVSNIAKWNGSEWSPLGSGLNGTVQDIAQVAGNIYVGGAFDSAGTVPAKHIARWNGSSWTALGNGLSGNVRSILPVGSELYAGGFFVLSGTDTVNYIARWNGFSWSGLGKGFNQGCLTLCLDNGLLYAGGSFTKADDTTANYVAVWNGSSWAPLGTGLSYSMGSGGVAALAAADGKLYASGLFDQAGVLEANSVAVYDGNSWQPLGDGLGNFSPVSYSSCVDYRGVLDYDVYFGGVFSSAGGKPSYNIAKYSVTSVDVEENKNQVPKDFSLKQNYPNPFNPSTKIKYCIARPSHVTIKIFDALGSEISVLVNEIKPAGKYQVELNARGLSSGIYFYQLNAGSFIQTKKMMLLK